MWGKLLGGDGHGLRKKRQVHLLTDGRRSRSDRQRIRSRIKARDEQLVECGRHRPGDRGGGVRSRRGASGAHQLLEVERDAVAASRKGESLVLRKAALERVDQLEPPAERQWV
jgi:hypothetical protein